ncbi:NYN domain-containing protein [Rubinisphaera margarita]|uniref:NYN domain-containing protein n=1 Tax=Rubinisphaera margarita TaxID=2909586 RepID=UPI001EE79796|nr:NYN domain-containing protein [Rubinisphaera margarita]MCG6154336.1 NYN domain-containing protein [Rubinisphaera margarita]
MPKQYLLIDGYNLLHASGMLSRTIDGVVLERARFRMLRFLEARLNPGERNRTSVIFDVGTGPTALPDHGQFAGMTVRFAVGYPDADTLIEELIREHSAPRQLTIVSSDHRLHKAARTRRAKPIDSDIFFDRLSRRSVRSKPRPQTEPDTKAIEQEISEWYAAQLPDEIETPEVKEAPDEVEFWKKRIQELGDES